MRGREEVVAALAVLEPEQQIAVLLPAPGRLVRLARHERREVHLLRTGLGHLLTDDGLDLRLDAQTQWQPREDAGSLRTDVSRPDQQLVAGDLCTGRVFAERTEEEFRETSDHGSSLVSRGHPSLRRGQLSAGSPDGTTPPPYRLTASSCSAVSATRCGSGP